MVNKVIPFILSFIPIIVIGHNLQGRYAGAISRDGSIQLVEMDFCWENGIQKGTYSIPEVGYYNVPLEDISFNKESLNLKFFYGNFYCFLSEDLSQITGISQYWEPKLRLHLKKKAKRSIQLYKGENIKFMSENLSLAGAIFSPRNTNEKIPYVILIHGSGAQDRNTPYYVSLAHKLAKNSVGVFFYDKRGCGRSEGDYEKATFADLANDVSSAFRYLQTRKDLNIFSIGLLGTSQGGWIAPIAANQINDCAFVILNVGPAVSLYEQEVHRVKYSMQNNGLEKSQVDCALQYLNAYFDFVKSNERKDYKKLEDLIDIINKKDWIEDNPLPDIGDVEWWRNNKYNPAENLRKLKCPVLSLFAEYDVLVPPQENKDKMESCLKEAGVEYRITIIPGCGHDMIGFHGLNGNNWDWPHVYWQWRKQPVEFIQEILDFIKKRKDK